MRKYKIVIEGRNLSVKINDIPTSVGFFATRIVKGADINSAQNIAIKLVEDELARISLNRQGNLPLLCVSEIHEIGVFEFMFKKPKGFTWFKEDVTSELTH